MDELIRSTDADAVRGAARRLLAAGITPEVHRDGDQHVLVVAPRDAAQAAAVLAGEPQPADPASEDLPPPGAVPAEPAPAEPAPAEPAPAEPAPAEPAPAPAGMPRATPLPAPEPLDEAALAALVVDARGFVVVAVAGPGEAGPLAARLVEGGIGAEVVPATETGHAGPEDPEARSVQVLEVDVDRALGLLGRDAPPPRRHVPAGPDAPGRAPTPAAVADLRPRAAPEEVRLYLGGRVNLTRRQLRTLLGIYVAALVLIPLGAFLLVRWVLTPEVEMPELPTSESVPSLLTPPGGPTGRPLAPDGALRSG